MTRITPTNVSPAAGRGGRHHHHHRHFHSFPAVAPGEPGQREGREGVRTGPVVRLGRKQIRQRRGGSNSKQLPDTALEAAGRHQGSSRLIWFADGPLPAVSPAVQRDLAPLPLRTRAPIPPWGHAHDLLSLNTSQGPSGHHHAGDRSFTVRGGGGAPHDRAPARGRQRRLGRPPTGWTWAKGLPSSSSRPPARLCTCSTCDLGSLGRLPDVWRLRASRMQDPDASSVPGRGGRTSLRGRPGLPPALRTPKRRLGFGVWTSVLGRPRAPSANGAGTQPEAGISPRPAARSELRWGHRRDPARGQEWNFLMRSLTVSVNRTHGQSFAGVGL